jgi:hypothetical protein
MLANTRSGVSTNTESPIRGVMCFLHIPTPALALAATIRSRVEI